MLLLAWIHAEGDHLASSTNHHKTKVMLNIKTNAYGRKSLWEGSVLSEPHKSCKSCTVWRCLLFFCSAWLWCKYHCILANTTEHCSTALPVRPITVLSKRHSFRKRKFLYRRMWQSFFYIVNGKCAWSVQSCVQKMQTNSNRTFTLTIRHLLACKITSNNVNLYLTF